MTKKKLLKSKDFDWVFEENVNIISLQVEIANNFLVVQSDNQVLLIALVAFLVTKWQVKQ